MNVKKIAAVIASALAAMVLVGCSNITSGVIVNKEFTASYTTHGTSCTSTKPLICHPTSYHHDDLWQVQLSNLNEDNETVTGWVGVPERLYADLNEGDYYNADTVTE